ncbi:hypothetical protein AB0M83_33240 [Amycolatopsis sp. NPDC051106]|uniref:hypothetical protein n=1 Tax=unclassified Amycolatopsis TaxID=2618356 RepID=UPI00342C7A88
MDDRPDDLTSILLAEYAALRSETERRATIQWNVFALQIASAGAIISLAIASATNSALLLVVPLTSYMLGNRYVLHAFHLKLIHRYVRDSLSDRLAGNLQWEAWRERELDRETAPGRRFTATGWNSLHPTRLAFVGVAALALAGALAAGIFLWVTRSPGWYVITAFGLGWVVDALATARLHRIFTDARGPGATGTSPAGAAAPPVSRTS